MYCDFSLIAKITKTRWTSFRVKLVFKCNFEISWSLGPLDLGTLGPLPSSNTSSYFLLHRLTSSYLFLLGITVSYGWVKFLSETCNISEQHLPPCCLAECTVPCYFPQLVWITPWLPRLKHCSLYRLKLLESTLNLSLLYWHR